MKIDYEKLESKEVEYIGEYGDKHTFIVAGCDPNIGLTLHLKGKKELNYICLNGPMSPNYNPADTKRFKAMFKYITEIINESGTLEFYKILKVKNAVSNGNNSSSYNGELLCAFSS